MPRPTSSLTCEYDYEAHDEYIDCADGTDDDLELLRDERQRLPWRMVLGLPCDLRCVGDDLRLGLLSLP